MWSADQLRSGLLTDLYHVDSAYVSWRSERNGLTTFDLYSRAPTRSARGYMLAAGLETGRHLRAANSATRDEEIASEAGQARTRTPSTTSCAGLRFTGEILAMPEGEIAFAPRAAACA